MEWRTWGGVGVGVGVSLKVGVGLGKGLRVGVRVGVGAGVGVGLFLTSLFCAALSRGLRQAMAWDGRWAPCRSQEVRSKE